MSPDKRQLLRLVQPDAECRRRITQYPGPFGLKTVTTASLIRIANLDELHGDGPHALSANGFDIVVVRAPAGLRAFGGAVRTRARFSRRVSSMETSSSAGTITGALASSLDSAKADRNASPRVPSSKGRAAPSSSTFQGFRVGRVESWQSAHWTICQVRGGCRFWATSISST